jgi:hypothetical protein
VSRKKNGLPTQQLTLSTTPQVVELLEKLVNSGFYGKNPAEAADRILSEQLRKLAKEIENE